jgi:hypothetical protein
VVCASQAQRESLWAAFPSRCRFTLNRSTKRGERLWVVVGSGVRLYFIWDVSLLHLSVNIISFVCFSAWAPRAVLFISVSTHCCSCDFLRYVTSFQWSDVSIVCESFTTPHQQAFPALERVINQDIRKTTGARGSQNSTPHLETPLHYCIAPAGLVGSPPYLACVYIRLRDAPLLD